MKIGGGNGIHVRPRRFDSGRADQRIGPRYAGKLYRIYPRRKETRQNDSAVQSLFSEIDSTCDRIAISYYNNAEEGASIFLAGNVDSETVEALLDTLSSYGVTKEKYDSFGYTYDSVKHMAKTSSVTYRGRTDYELGLLPTDTIKANLPTKTPI